MTKLLEIKDQLIRFYRKYETYLYPIVKFAVALALFTVINTNIGFMEKISAVSATSMESAYISASTTIAPIHNMALVGRMAQTSASSNATERRTDGFSSSLEAVLISRTSVIGTG